MVLTSPASEDDQPAASRRVRVGPTSAIAEPSETGRTAVDTLRTKWRDGSRPPQAHWAARAGPLARCACGAITAVGPGTWAAALRVAPRPFAYGPSALRQ